MNTLLLVLLGILWLKQAATDNCIGDVIAIFSTGFWDDELNIVTKHKHFIVMKYRVHPPPFLNMYYDEIKVLEFSARVSEVLQSIIDIDYAQNRYYALKREHKEVKLVRLDLDTGQMYDEQPLNDPDAMHVTSFVMGHGHISFYFHLGDHMLMKNYTFFLNEEKLDLQHDPAAEVSFRFEFSKVTYLNATNSSLPYGFLHEQDLYLTDGLTIDAHETSDSYHVINLNRLTNCLATLCAVKKIDGFIHLPKPEQDKSRIAAVLVNNNYFFVSNIIDINGSTPVQHFPNYEFVRFAFTCESLFTLDSVNYCFRNKMFYQIEYVDGQFDIQVLVATKQDPFVDNFNMSPDEFRGYWLEYIERPVAVLKLFNKAAILFSTSYVIWTAASKSYESKPYEYLFPNHDRENRIQAAFYDEERKRYLFVGSKFHFIYRHTQLNDHNQFFEKFVKLSQPLYTNCVVATKGENSFIMALVLGIFICFVLIILLIFCIYCRHCRHRIALQPHAREQAVPETSRKKELVFSRRKS